MIGQQYLFDIIYLPENSLKKSAWMEIHCERCKDTTLRK